MILILGTRTITINPQRLVQPADFHYNCAVFRWRARYHLLYRYESWHNVMTRGSRLAITTLGDDWQPVGPTYKLDPPHKVGIEDPRIFEHENRLFVSYCSGAKQHLMELDPEFQIVRDQQLYVEGENSCEKNWTYWCHEGRVYCAYSWSPHRIYEVEDKSGRWQLRPRWTHDVQLGWKWGQIRGGTNPVLFGDEYYTWFHSSYRYPYGDIFDDRIYTAGLLVFEHTPPFRLKRISTQPLLTPDFQDIQGPTPCAVVFPCGAARVRDGARDKWVVSYGSNDYQCKLSFFDDRELKLVERRI